MNTDEFWIRPKNPPTLELSKKSELIIPDPDNYHPKKLNRYKKDIKESSIIYVEKLLGMKSRETIEKEEEWRRNLNKVPMSKDTFNLLFLFLFILLGFILLFPFFALFLFILALILIAINAKIDKEEKEKQDRKQLEFERILKETINSRTREKKIELIKEEVEEEYRKKIASERDTHNKICNQIKALCNKMKEALTELQIEHKSLVRSLNGYAKIEDDLILIRQLFSENRYAEFWEKSEMLAEKIKANEGKMRRLVELQKEFEHITKGILKDCEHNFPYPYTPNINWYKLRIAILSFRSLIRKAETIYEFASIYQMILTRKEIKKGFKSISKKVEEISDEIQETIIDLGHSMTLGIVLLGNKIQQNTEELRSVVSTIEYQTDSFQTIETGLHEDNLKLLEFVESSEEERMAENQRLQEELEKQTDILDDIRNRKKA